MRRLGVPQPAADGARPGLAVHVVAGIWALAARAGEGGAEVRLVRRGVLAEADVPVYPEVDVLEGELGDGGVGGDDLLREGLDVAGPVFEGAAELWIDGWVVEKRVSAAKGVCGWEHR